MKEFVYGNNDTFLVLLVMLLVISITLKLVSQLESYIAYYTHSEYLSLRSNDVSRSNIECQMHVMTAIY